jgi:hypothetical protein
MRAAFLSLVLGVAAAVGTLAVPSNADARPTCVTTVREAHRGVRVAPVYRAHWHGKHLRKARCCHTGSRSRLALHGHRHIRR